MIVQRRLLIFGNSLLTDGLVHLLEPNRNVAIVGSVCMLEEVLPYLKDDQFDILVIAGGSGFSEESAGQFLGNHANISLLYIYPDRSYMELFSVRRVNARYADLMDAIEVRP